MRALSEVLVHHKIEREGRESGHLGALHGCAEGDYRAVGLGVTLQSKHKGMAIHDPGAGGEQGLSWRGENTPTHKNPATFGGAGYLIQGELHGVRGRCTQQRTQQKDATDER